MKETTTLIPDGMNGYDAVTWGVIQIQEATDAMEIILEALESEGNGAFHEYLSGRLDLYHSAFAMLWQLIKKQAAGIQESADKWQEVCKQAAASPAAK